jgi:hypothetical protein
MKPAPFSLLFNFSMVTVVLLALQTVQAKIIPNGDFSDGLNGWTVESGNVTDGGYALFQEHPTQILSTLKQEFTLPDWTALLLSFDVKMLAEPGGDKAPFAWPDAFTASLLDPVTSEPLVSNPGRTDFFYMDNTNSIITIGTLTVTVDLTGLGDRDVGLYFDLIGSNDGRLTTVRLSNVEIIPEPCSLVLWLIGTGTLGFLRRSRIRKTV